VTEYTITAALVAGVLALSEATKALAGRLLANRNGRVLSAREHEMLQRLHDMHDRVDTDGTPLWYVPRSWSETQARIVDVCQQIDQSQRLIVETLQRIERRLEKE